MLKRIRMMPLAIVALLALGSAGAPAADDAVAQFYKSKGLAITVGASAGGGIDLYARLVARHLGSHLPGNPTVVVQNMPGAGGLQQMNHLAKVAPKDGSLVGLINPNMTIAPILTPDFAKYDPVTFSWIGSVNTEIGTCAFWPRSKISTVDDLAKRKIAMAGIGPAGGSTLDATTLRDVLGFQFEIVLGYPGITEAALAAERGEVDGMCGLNLSTLRSVYWDAIKRGDIKVLLRTSLRDDPDLAGAKSVFELAKTEEQRQMMQVVFGPWTYGRPLVAPPATDPEHLAALRRAFAETMTDQGFLGDAAKARLDVKPLPPDEIVKVIKAIYATPPDVLEKTRIMLTPKKP
jgi:tripartite-type tricarboxylate transporter receptor subunit TctC